MTNLEIIDALKACVAPCVLISGAGLLILSVSNRLARPIDRIRLIVAHIKENPNKATDAAKKQIKIFYKRCEFLRASIAFATWHVICVSLIMLVLFLSVALQIQVAAYVSALFVIGLVCLICSLVFFLLDIRLTLRSLEIEIEEAHKII